MKSTVSIVICNYNREKLVARAIRSCLSQVCNQRQVEIIVVDDGSTDNSISIIKSFGNEIKLISLPENKGVSHASNVGLDNAVGDYWIRVDSDDYLSSNAINIYSLILDHNKHLDYVFGDVLRLSIHGEVLKRINLSVKYSHFEYGAGVLFRRDQLLELGGYDESLRNAEDYDLFSRLRYLNKKYLHVPIPLYRYYDGLDNLTKSPDRKESIKNIKRKYNV